MANKEQFLDRNGVSHFYLLIKNKLTTYFKTLFVSKKDGYDLSQNDFTNELKTKLEGLSNSGGSGVSDYNELLNRPVYGEVFHSFFDADETPDVDSIDIMGYRFYRVSSLTPSVDQMLSADIYRYGRLQEKLTEDKILVTGEINGEIGFVFFYGGYCVSYTTEEVPFTYQGNPLTVKTNFTGIYMTADGLDNETFEIEYGDIKRLDDMYIPKNIPRLDKSGLISAKNLPSYVDDVVEGYATDDINISFHKEKNDNGDYLYPIYGEKGKIYVDLNTGNTYRWSGSQYVKIESSAGLTALTNTEIDEIITSVDSSTE